MEQLTIRDWMVIIGAGLILAVLVDAARRVWRERRAEVRLNAKITRADDAEREDEPFNLLAELPNGGARIVARDDLQPESSVHRGDHDDVDVLHVDDDLGDISFSATDDDVIPDDAPSSQDATLTPPAAQDDGALVDTSIGKAGFATPVPEAPVVPTETPLVAEPRPMTKPQKSTATRRKTTATPDAPETLDWLEELDTDAPAASEARLPRDVEPHVFVLNVVARSTDGFAGSDILQILLACDLRFGDMDFFHRHESASGRGPIQFSVANMMNPGVFDIDVMDELRTRGLMFFVTLPGPDNMLQAFDYMYETARTVANNLDGDVLDETRSAITRQSLEHMRQQIRELERRLMVDRER